jgi:hypothetical protein
LAKLRLRKSTAADLERYTQVKPTELADFMLGCDFLPPEVESKALERVWQAATKAVEEHVAQTTQKPPTEAVAEPPTEAAAEHGAEAVIEPAKAAEIPTAKGTKDDDPLDAMTRAMWAEVPFHKRFALFRNILIAMVGFAVAGTLLPFDGGASLLLVAKANVILGGTEILAILVGGPLLGTILSTSGAKSLMEVFRSGVARPQMDILYAALCDGLGIPRYLEGAPALGGRKKTHQITEVDLPAQKNEVGVLQGRLVRLDEAAWDRMMDDLGNLER